MQTIKWFSRGPNSKAHPYPLNLDMTIRKKIQGVFTYFIITDQATYLHFSRGPNSYNEFDARIRSQGFTNGIDNESWQDFKLYIEAKPEPLAQQIIFNIEFSWDRYLNGIREFIQKGNKSLNINFSNDDNKIIKRMHLSPFPDVVSCIDRNIGFTDISHKEIDSVTELSLLRNLGVHNDWIIDETYLQKTKETNVILGELRVFTASDIAPLYQDLLISMRKITSVISKFYKDFYSTEFE